MVRWPVTLCCAPLGRPIASFRCETEVGRYQCIADFLANFPAGYSVTGRSAAVQAGPTIEYRDDADVRAVLAVECVVGEQASPMSALAHVIEMFRPSTP